MIQPAYLGSKPADVSVLAALLDVEVAKLVRLSNTAESLYHQTRLRKKNGGYRTIHAPSDELKAIQRTILRRILRKVNLPSYLQGSVEGRDYISNAKLHTKKAVLIQEDIKDFFPSVNSEEVKLMWIRIFGFDVDICEILTQLTTYKGFLPQGAPTSSDIANLVLFDLESELYDELNNIGLVYSRYVDDINISCKQDLKPHEIAGVRKKLYAILKKKGLRPNKAKSHVLRKSGRMRVHGFNVNTSRPTRSKTYRNNLRSAVHNCERAFQKHGGKDPDYKREFQSTYGLLVELRRTSRREAEKLLARLERVKPYARYATYPTSDEVDGP